MELRRWRLEHPDHADGKHPTAASRCSRRLQLRRRQPCSTGTQHCERHDCELDRQHRVLAQSDQGQFRDTVMFVNRDTAMHHIVIDGGADLQQVAPGATAAALPWRMRTR